jgi:hypothetical protein
LSVSGAPPQFFQLLADDADAHDCPFIAPGQSGLARREREGRWLFSGFLREIEILLVFQRIQRLMRFMQTSLSNQNLGEVAIRIFYRFQVGAL